MAGLQVDKDHRDLTFQRWHCQADSCLSAYGYAPPIFDRIVYWDGEVMFPKWLRDNAEVQYQMQERIQGFEFPEVGYPRCVPIC